MDHIQWAINILNKNGYQIQKTIPDIIQDTPWAVVTRFETDQGLVYLKKVPPLLSIEPKIITVLYEEFHAHVPRIIADNQEEHCFLMNDAGIQLHEYFKKQFQEGILIHAMRDYTNLQIMTSDKINLFLEMGVPDWRLASLPKLFHNLIMDEKILLDDGITQDELIQSDPTGQAGGLMSVTP
jgi:hypothetical protein